MCKIRIYLNEIYYSTKRLARKNRRRLLVVVKVVFTSMRILFQTCTVWGVYKHSPTMTTNNAAASSCARPLPSAVTVIFRGRRHCGRGTLFLRGRRRAVGLRTMRRETGGHAKHASTYDNDARPSTDRCASYNRIAGAGPSARKHPVEHAPPQRCQSSFYYDGGDDDVCRRTRWSPPPSGGTPGMRTRRVDAAETRCVRTPPARRSRA